MKRIYAQDEVETLAPDRKLWTAVIPVAGKGSRLGYSQPKTLYPVLGRPILHWLLEIIGAACEKIVLVASPDGLAAIRAAAEKVIPAARLTFAVQETPRGMGDAILRAKPFVSTQNTLVVWGDQVTLRASTIHRTQALHAGRPGAKLTFPTVLKNHPYIHFFRSADDRITRVFQARNATEPRENGETDCGLFAFQRGSLFGLIDEMAGEHSRTPEKGAELNLLPGFPRLDQTLGDVAVWRLEDEEQTLGVNTPEDVNEVEAILCRRLPPT